MVKILLLVSPLRVFFLGVASRNCLFGWLGGLYLYRFFQQCTEKEVKNPRIVRSVVRHTGMHVICSSGEQRHGMRDGKDKRDEVHKTTAF